jgi:uncharacterized protein (DUF488 family)
LPITHISTIGGYGFSEQTFLGALRQHGVDTFIDVRQRRGVRGVRYSFLNSRRLQSMLEEAGIRYVYAPELAPTKGIRFDQTQADRQSGVAKSERRMLSPLFVERYKAEVLSHVNLQPLRERLAGANVITLFCVEREPAACHRSLAARFLTMEFGLDSSVQNLMP